MLPLALRVFMFEAALFAMVCALTYGTVTTSTITNAANAAIAILLFLVNLTIFLNLQIFCVIHFFVLVFKKQAALLICTKNVH
jgi:hypothetical protein